MYNLKKSLFMVVLGILCVLFIGNKAHSTQQYFYQSETIDECIREKECVWYAFERLSLSSSALVAKWNRPIKIKVIGGYVNEAEAVIDTVSKSFPYEISVESTYDILLFFSEDVESDIEKYSSLFQNILEDDVVYRFYKQLRNKECFNINFLGKKNIIDFSVVFVTVNPEIREACLNQHLFQALGFFQYIQGFPFSVSNLGYEQPKEITQLDLFLLQILYDSKFKAHMTPDEKKKAFDEIYPVYLTHFLESQK